MPSIVVEEKCTDFGRPGCLEVFDERYTMNFDDIDEPPIRFCSFCGPINHDILKVLEDGARTQGQTFVDKWNKIVDDMVADNKTRKS